MNVSAVGGRLQSEPGSFRDPDGRVVYGEGGRVLRALGRDGATAWEELADSDLLRHLTDQGRVVGTRIASDLDAETLGCAAILEHDRVPFVSYPFEWTFEMLRDAAVLHLEIVLEALSEGMTTKDGTAYNVQWRGSSPLFIDLCSFTRSSGGPWQGYRQFCETFLNPLLLQAYRGVDFHPWLRGRLHGIPTTQMRRLLSGRDLLRKGVLTHVVLHELFQRRSAEGAQAAGAVLKNAGFDLGVTRTVVAELLRLVERLNWRPRPSPWSAYPEERPYSAEDLHHKADFVREAVRAAVPRLVWDLGCNDGAFSRVAAAHADYVVAMDGDHAIVERLYRSLRAGGGSNILPLVADVTDPSPAVGWRGKERRTLHDRGGPDVVLCLALVHHLAITANIPLDEILSWLRSLGGRVVIEFVERSDPMVQRLLANKAIEHAEYSRATFEALLARRFAVARRLPLPSGTRTLYDAAPK